jgi:hypothetical protein
MKQLSLFALMLMVFIVGCGPEPSPVITIKTGDFGSIYLPLEKSFSNWFLYPRGKLYCTLYYGGMSSQSTFILATYVTGFRIRYLRPIYFQILNQAESPFLINIYDSEIPGWRTLEVLRVTPEEITLRAKETTT